MLGPYRDTRSERRPRFWVPGVLYFAPQRDGWRIETGSRAGWLTDREWIEQWQGSRFFIDPRQASDKERHRLNLRVPEELAQHREHARAWLERVPVVVLGASLASEAKAMGLEVHEVGFASRPGSDGVDFFWYSRWSHDEEVISISGTRIGLAEGCLGLPLAALDRLSDEELSDRARGVQDDLIDRILSAATGGTLDERSIAAAHQVELLRKDRRLVDELEATFSEVLKRADRQRAEAEEIAAALCVADRDRARIAGYGLAHRTRHPELLLRGSAADSDGELRLPPRDRWTLPSRASVESWEPRAHVERYERAVGMVRTHLMRQRRVAAASLSFGAAVLTVLAWLALS